MRLNHGFALIHEYLYIISNTNTIQREWMKSIVQMILFSSSHLYYNRRGDKGTACRDHQSNKKDNHNMDAVDPQ